MSKVMLGAVTLHVLDDMLHRMVQAVFNGNTLQPVPFSMGGSTLAHDEGTGAEPRQWDQVISLGNVGAGGSGCVAVEATSRLISNQSDSRMVTSHSVRFFLWHTTANFVPDWDTAFSITG
jgi:hypothetical protein